MAGPALAGLLLFIAVPFLMAVGLSLTNLRLGSPLPLEWVGFQQYERIFGDPAFRRALVNNAVFALVVVPVQTALALGLALLLNRPLAGRVWFRTFFFMPVVFPMALVAVVWQLILAPGAAGPLNALLGLATFGLWEPLDFLNHSGAALPSIMLMSIWQGAGFQMVILLAGLQGIPSTYYEAAAIDGAGRWQQFLHVTLPGLRNTLIFVVLVTTILAFRLFDQVDILTRGGPNNATTTVMFEGVTSAFRRQQVARAAAITVVFFVIVLAITLVQRRLLREEREIS
ncbi:MAG: sugar ABC transporter permease [Puniceicoccaceae bacterium]|nr:MAG: sugar ABC transporter permease [Puniceicoccaceae bacterium]